MAYLYMNLAGFLSLFQLVQGRECSVALLQFPGLKLSLRYCGWLGDEISFSMDNVLRRVEPQNYHRVKGQTSVGPRCKHEIFPLVYAQALFFLAHIWATGLDLPA